MTDASDSVDRPASKDVEIVVTAEMISAGALARAEYDEMFYSTDEHLSAIYRAMTMAKLLEDSAKMNAGR
jgi:hypothetical protein